MRLAVTHDDPRRVAFPRKEGMKLLGRIDCADDGTGDVAATTKDELQSSEIGGETRTHEERVSHRLTEAVQQEAMGKRAPLRWPLSSLGGYGNKRNPKESSLATEND